MTEMDDPGAVAAPEAARVRLASSRTASLDALRALANDPAVVVRAALALNPKASGCVDTLICDRDDRVRAVLARRLANLLPGLGRGQMETLQNRAMAGLRQLVTDEAVRVRAAIADAVKDMAEVPHDLVLRLAGDADIQVAEPVIRLSPLLTEADLLGLLETSPCPQAATAVARRPELAACVADRIAAGTDAGAIQALLSNRSAAIREATLDGLIARAAQHVAWHGPLVRRPLLSARAAQALSAVVTGQILAELAQRADLSPALSRDLQAMIGSSCHTDPVADPVADDAAGGTMQEAQRQAAEMARQGPITEEAVLYAARRGEARLCTALLAMAAGVTIAVVDRACSLRSAKGLVSLIWQAGFSPRCGPALQSALLRLPPEAILHAAMPDTYPLAIDEMRWQIEFLSRIGH